MPFVKQQKNINNFSTLCSFKGPFELLHTDIADITSAKSAVDPKCCLLFVDLFTSNIYTYPMKNRSLLVKKNPIILQ